MCKSMSAVSVDSPLMAWSWRFLLCSDVFFCHIMLFVDGLLVAVLPDDANSTCKQRA